MLPLTFLLPRPKSHIARAILHKRALQKTPVPKFEIDAKNSNLRRAGRQFLHLRHPADEIQSLQGPQAQVEARQG